MSAVVKLYDDSNVISLTKIKGGKKENIKGTPPGIECEDRWMDPIRDKEDVKRVVEYLHNKAVMADREDTKRAAWRDWLLFVIGINVGIRVSDLITLTWEKFFEKDMKTFKDATRKKEQKTGKMKDVCPNPIMEKAIMEYLKAVDIEIHPSDYLFLSGRKNSKGEYGHITRSPVEKLMKEVATECHLKGDYNTHSLRKTYAYQKYMMYVANGDPLALPKIQKDLNHSKTEETIVYLGIDREEKIKSSQGLSDWWDF